MKFTSPGEVLTLAKAIGTDMQDIDELCNDLRRDLNTLKESFLDDQILEIEEALSKIQSLVENNMEAVKYVLNELIQYARALQAVKGY